MTTSVAYELHRAGPRIGAEIVGVDLNQDIDDLSDGQKSLLYISLVLAWQALARRVLSGEDTTLEQGDVQALIATHAPTLLRRVHPESICFLRLNADRETTVHRIVLPDDDEVAAKYVREAVQAYPELCAGHGRRACFNDRVQHPLQRGQLLHSRRVLPASRPGQVDYRCRWPRDHLRHGVR